MVFDKEVDLPWVIEGIAHAGESTWFGALPKQMKTWVKLAARGWVGYTSVLISFHLRPTLLLGGMSSIAASLALCLKDRLVVPCTFWVGSVDAN